MGMSIYEIDRAITALADPETGEITDWEALDALQMAREAKLENVACWIKNLRAEASAIKAEEDALSARRKALESKGKSLEQYLANVLDGEKFQTAKCSVTWRKTTAVEITDARSAADWCEEHGLPDLVTYAAPRVSKTELGKLLRTKAEIPGAKLVKSMSMGVK